MSVQQYLRKAIEGSTLPPLKRAKFLSDAMMKAGEREIKDICENNGDNVFDIIYDIITNYMTKGKGSVSVKINDVESLLKCLRLLFKNLKEKAKRKWKSKEIRVLFKNLLGPNIVAPLKKSAFSLFLFYLEIMDPYSMSQDAITNPNIVLFYYALELIPNNINIDTLALQDINFSMFSDNSVSENMLTIMNQLYLWIGQGATEGFCQFYSRLIYFFRTIGAFIFPKETQAMHLHELEDNCELRVEKKTFSQNKTPFKASLTILGQFLIHFYSWVVPYINDAHFRIPDKLYAVSTTRDQLVFPLTEVKYYQDLREGMVLNNYMQKFISTRGISTNISKIFVVNQHLIAFTVSMIRKFIVEFPPASFYWSLSSDMLLRLIWYYCVYLQDNPGIGLSEFGDISDSFNNLLQKNQSNTVSGNYTVQNEYSEKNELCKSESKDCAEYPDGRFKKMRENKMLDKEKQDKISEDKYLRGKFIYGFNTLPPKKAHLASPIFPSTFSLIPHTPVVLGSTFDPIVRTLPYYVCGEPEAILSALMYLVGLLFSGFRFQFNNNILEFLQDVGMSKKTGKVGSSSELPYNIPDLYISIQDNDIDAYYSSTEEWTDNNQQNDLSRTFGDIQTQQQRIRKTVQKSRRDKTKDSDTSEIFVPENKNEEMKEENRDENTCKNEGQPNNMNAENNTEKLGLTYDTLSDFGKLVYNSKLYAYHIELSMVLNIIDYIIRVFPLSNIIKHSIIIGILAAIVLVIPPNYSSGEDIKNRIKEVVKMVDENERIRLEKESEYGIEMSSSFEDISNADEKKEDEESSNTLAGNSKQDSKYPVNIKDIQELMRELFQEDFKRKNENKKLERTFITKELLLKFKRRMSLLVEPTKIPVDCELKHQLFRLLFRVYIKLPKYSYDLMYLPTNHANVAFSSKYKIVDTLEAPDQLKSSARPSKNIFTYRTPEPSGCITTIDNHDNLVYYAIRNILIERNTCYPLIYEYNQIMNVMSGAFLSCLSTFSAGKMLKKTRQDNLSSSVENVDNSTENNNIANPDLLSSFSLSSVSPKNIFSPTNLSVSFIPILEMSIASLFSSISKDNKYSGEKDYVYGDMENYDGNKILKFISTFGVHVTSAVRRSIDVSHREKNTILSKKYRLTKMENNYPKLVKMCSEDGNNYNQLWNQLNSRKLQKEKDKNKSELFEKEESDVEFPSNLYYHSQYLLHSLIPKHCNVQLMCYAKMLGYSTESAINNPFMYSNDLTPIRELYLSYDSSKLDCTNAAYVLLTRPVSIVVGNKKTRSTGGNPTTITKYGHLINPMVSTCCKYKIVSKKNSPKIFKLTLMRKQPRRILMSMSENNNNIPEEIAPTIKEEGILQNNENNEVNVDENNASIQDSSNAANTMTSYVTNESAITSQTNFNNVKNATEDIKENVVVDNSMERKENDKNTDSFMIKICGLHLHKKTRSDFYGGTNNIFATRNSPLTINNSVTNKNFPQNDEGEELINIRETQQMQTEGRSKTEQVADSGFNRKKVIQTLAPILIDDFIVIFNQLLDIVGSPIYEITKMSRPTKEKDKFLRHILYSNLTQDSNKEVDLDILESYKFLTENDNTLDNKEGEDSSNSKISAPILLPSSIVLQEHCAALLYVLTITDVTRMLTGPRFIDIDTTDFTTNYNIKHCNQMEESANRMRFLNCNSFKGEVLLGSDFLKVTNNSVEESALVSFIIRESHFPEIVLGNKTIVNSMLSILNFTQMWNNDENDHDSDFNIYYAVDGFSMLNNFVRKPGLNSRFSSSSSRLVSKVQTSKSSVAQTSIVPSSVESVQFDSVSLLRQDLQTTQSSKRYSGPFNTRSRRNRASKRNSFSLYTGENEFNMFEEKSMINLVFSKGKKEEKKDDSEEQFIHDKGMLIKKGNVQVEGGSKRKRKGVRKLMIEKFSPDFINEYYNLRYITSHQKERLLQNISLFNDMEFHRQTVDGTKRDSLYGISVIDKTKTSSENIVNKIENKHVGFYKTIDSINSRNLLIPLMGLVISELMNLIGQINYNTCSNNTMAYMISSEIVSFTKIACTKFGLRFVGLMNKYKDRLIQFPIDLFDEDILVLCILTNCYNVMGQNSPLFLIRDFTNIIQALSLKLINGDSITKYYNMKSRKPDFSFNSLCSTIPRSMKQDTYDKFIKLKPIAEYLHDKEVRENGYYIGKYNMYPLAVKYPVGKINFINHFLYTRVPKIFITNINSLLEIIALNSISTSLFILPKSLVGSIRTDVLSKNSSKVNSPSISRKKNSEKEFKRRKTDKMTEATLKYNFVNSTVEELLSDLDSTDRFEKKLEEILYIENRRDRTSYFTDNLQQIYLKTLVQSIFGKKVLSFKIQALDILFNAFIYDVTDYVTSVIDEKTKDQYNRRHYFFLVIGKWMELLELLFLHLTRILVSTTSVNFIRVISHFITLVNNSCNILNNHGVEYRRTGYEVIEINDIFDCIIRMLIVLCDKMEANSVQEKSPVQMKSEKSINVEKNLAELAQSLLNCISSLLSKRDSICIEHVKNSDSFYNTISRCISSSNNVIKQQAVDCLYKILLGNASMIINGDSSAESLKEKNSVLLQEFAQKDYKGLGYDDKINFVEKGVRLYQKIKHPYGEYLGTDRDSIEYVMDKKCSGNDYYRPVELNEPVYFSLNNDVIITLSEEKEASVCHVVTGKNQSTNIFGDKNWRSPLIRAVLRTSVGKYCFIIRPTKPTVSKGEDVIKDTKHCNNELIAENYSVTETARDDKLFEVAKDNAVKFIEETNISISDLPGDPLINIMTIYQDKYLFVNEQNSLLKLVNPKFQDDDFGEGNYASLPSEDNTMENVELLQNPGQIDSKVIEDIDTNNSIHKITSSNEPLNQKEDVQEDLCKYDDEIGSHRLLPYDLTRSLLLSLDSIGIPVLSETNDLVLVLLKKMLNATGGNFKPADLISSLISYNRGMSPLGGYKLDGLIKKLDMTPSRLQCNVGVMYVAPHQTHEKTIFGNTRGSRMFELFISRLGEEIGIEYLSSSNSNIVSRRDGEKTIVHNDEDEMIFHVSTKMVYPDEFDNVTKKKYIGLDNIVIVWNEGDIDVAQLTTDDNIILMIIEPLSYTHEKYAKVQIITKEYSSTIRNYLNGYSLDIYGSLPFRSILPASLLPELVCENVRNLCRKLFYRINNNITNATQRRLLIDKIMKTCEYPANYEEIINYWFDNTSNALYESDGI